MTDTQEKAVERRLRLQLDVVYKDEVTEEDKIRVYNAFAHVVENGCLSGDGEQETESWTMGIRPPDADVPAPPPTQVWLAQLDQHETETRVCASEEAAYEKLVQVAYEAPRPEGLPENGEVEDICVLWNELYPDEYMRVVGPLEVIK